MQQTSFYFVNGGGKRKEPHPGQSTPLASSQERRLQPKFSKLHAESQRRTRNFDSFSVKSAWAIIKSTST
ncbi:hypothetical protein CGGC5_v005408 [Colletotrichum fructicola Nara gc5]|uniref:Uncharacterized protein n=1 Tax=Colletotrichum fructicola (strain Nara gc5) TaxID=1213859 RepID=A0A7J6JBG5_COLFN|nr:hypothetical protein CGGC5_v005408 [Colletotrichum fructicola Nara gc5]